MSRQVVTMLLLGCCCGFLGRGLPAAFGQAPPTLHIPMQQLGGAKASMPSALLDRQFYVATDAGQPELWFGSGGSDILLAFPLAVQSGGTGMPTEHTLNFTGAGVSLADDPTNHRTTITIAGSSGGGGSGTVTSVSASTSLTGLTASVTNPTTTPAISLSGTLGIASGGTGQTTASAALNALLPAQTGSSGKYLTTDGTNASWGTVSTGTSFTAAGDLSGSSTSQTVIGLQGHSLAAPTTAGYVEWNGSAWAYSAGTTPTGTANAIAGYDGSGNLTAASPLTWDANTLLVAHSKTLRFVTGSGYWDINDAGGNDLVFGGKFKLSNASLNGGAIVGATVFVPGYHVVLPPIDGFGNALLWAIDASGTYHRAQASSSDGNFISGIKVGTDPLPRPVYSETPGGTPNGTLTTFSLANTPIGGVAVYVGSSATNLQRLDTSAYSVGGTTLTFTTAPASGSHLLVDYSY